MLQDIESFFDRNPALFIGMSLLLGSLILHPVSVVSATVFCALNFRRSLQAIVLMTAMFFYAGYPVKKDTRDCRAIVKINEIQSYCNAFKRGKRALVSLQDGQKALLYFKEVPKFESYLVNGTFKESAIFPKEMVPINEKVSIAFMRYQTKEMLRKKLYKKMGHESCSADLIYALLSGECDNSLIKLSFNKLGLSHLLAISGFHFSILISALSMLFVKKKKSRMLLLLLIGVATIYFLFVGGFASIKRAYVMLVVLLVGDLLREKSSPINTLGVALTILLIIDPKISLNVGFQLSFIATFSILLFVRPMTALLEKLLPRRKKEMALLLGPISLSAYIFNSFLRKILIINTSVYVLCLPVILFYFGKVPILGFYYNLFVPMLIAALLLLAIISLICPLFFPLLKWGAETLISGLLYYPTHLDFAISWEAMPLPILALTLFVLILLGIKYQRLCYSSQGSWQSLPNGS